MLAPLPEISACRKCLSKNHLITRHRMTSLSSDSDSAENSPVLVPSEAKDWNVLSWNSALRCINFSNSGWNRASRGRDAIKAEWPGKSSAILRLDTMRWRKASTSVFSLPADERLPKIASDVSSKTAIIESLFIFIMVINGTGSELGWFRYL